MVKQSAAVSAKTKATRAKYPQFRSLSVPSSGSSTSASTNLAQLVEVMCAHELKVLEDWLSSEGALKKEVEARGVLGSVRAVLQALPEQISPNAGPFQPELSKAERTTLRALSAQVAELQALKDKVQEFAAMAADMGIASSADHPEGAEVSKDVEESLCNYKDILQRMDRCCTQVLQLTSETSRQLHVARQAQDQLYDKCSEKRSQSLSMLSMSSSVGSASASGRRAVPSAAQQGDPREAVRALPKFLKSPM